MMKITASQGPKGPDIEEEKVVYHPMSWLAVTFTTQEINSLRLLPKKTGPKADVGSSLELSS